MEEIADTYAYEDSTLKTSGWASNYYYMTKYLKEWFVNLVIIIIFLILSISLGNHYL